MNNTSFFAHAVADFLFPDLVATEDFGKHLAYTEKALRDVTTEAVAINLERMDETIKEQVPKTWKVRERRCRTLITLVGQVSYHRRVYEDEYGSRRYLLDEILGISAYQRIETTAFIWLVYRAAEVSYEKACKQFKERSGVSITRSTVMRCVHKEGELLFANDYRDACDPLISTPVIFNEFDGFWINLQSETKQAARTRHTYKAQFRKKSKEMKVWVSYGGIHNSKRSYPVHWASDANPGDFFKECMEMTGSVYALDDAEYIVSGSDAAAWCKNNEIDELTGESSTTISKLDTFHVNQHLYRAFSDEEDRSSYLNLLYARNFAGFLDALGKRIEKEPEDAKIRPRKDLYNYVEANLDWLDSLSLSGHIRESLLIDLPAVFGDRPFCGHLEDILKRRRYKHFLGVLEKIVETCDERLRYDYGNYLVDAQHAIDRINFYRPTKLGTMEGANAKVYAARLKVWGCSWSERGAIAMMRIRACIHSGRPLIAPGYNSWLTEQEKEKIEASRHFNYDVTLSVGEGYAPVSGSLPFTAHLAPKLYGMLNYGRGPLSIHIP